MMTREFFQVMQDFADQVTDPALKQNLLNAIKRKKPFREFKLVIDSSDRCRQLWFSYKELCYIEWVKGQQVIMGEGE